MSPDVVLIALASVDQDARTLNLARALGNAGVETAVVGATLSDLGYEPFQFLEWNDPGGRAIRRMLSLESAVRKARLSPKIVAGMDLFAMRSAIRIKKKTSAKLVYDMREFYFALGTLAMSPFKQGIVTALEEGAVKRSDRILVSGELDADVVTEKYALAERPTVILNSPPYKDEQQSSILRDTHSIPADNTIVLYQGVVHHGRGIAPFLKAMPSMPNVSFCVVGEGPSVDDMKVLSVELGVDHRVHWHGSVPYDELHEVTSSCDIGLCIIEPISKSYEYALPNKLFEYMMARKPVICTDLPALHEELTTRPFGMLIGRGLSAAEITSAVSQLQVPATYNAMKPTTTAAQAIAYERQAQLAVDLFRELL